MRQKMKQLMGILLTLALVLGLIPGMSLTAYADDDPPYAQYKNTTTVIKFDEKDWYLINYDAGTVTLLAKECVASSKYNESESFVEYSSNPTVKTAVDNWYKTNITADAKKAVSGGAMFLLTIGEANAINAKVRKDATAYGGGWWLCSRGSYDKGAAFVGSASGNVYDDGTYVYYPLGVRPALKLNLSSVIFSSVNLSGGANATTNGGGTSQNYFDVGSTRSAMTTVTYTANSGYKFPETSDYYTTTNGIKVERTSDPVVTVSGIPTANTTITIPDAHTHSFTYSANGATITATCTADGCDLPEVESKHVATLTIAASGGTFDGTTAYGATITDAYSIQGDAKVQYQKKTGESTYDTATETAPTDAGDYKASITAGGATASVEYSIAQADPTANAPAGLTATYGQTLADVSLEGKNPDSNTPGTWAWADSTKSVGDVVTPAAAFKATFTPDSSNYKTVENVDVPVTVGKANAAAATVTANNRTYDGTKKPLVTVTGTATGGEMQYALGKDATTVPESDWDKAIPTATKAGTYNVWYKVKGDENHNDVDPKCVTAVITGSTPMVTTSASVLLRTMTVNWTKDKSVKNYKVAYRKAGSSKWTIKKTSQPGYVVWNQKTRECYEYKVAAVIDTKEMWSDVDYRYFNTVSTKTKAGKGTITVSWCKDNNSSGYQIMVATNKNMNDAQIINAASSKKSYVVSGLKKGKTYYVRVRPMKLRGDVTYVGILSNTCKVKVK